MAFFGTPTAYVGIDIGTASLKLVELVARSRRIEVGTYAHADVPNTLVYPKGEEKGAVATMTKIISKMMDEAGTSSEHVIAALPNSVVFSTVISLPNIPEEEMSKAVQFAARDVVPADINDMALGWSKVGQELHMDVDVETEDASDKGETEEVQKTISDALLAGGEGPVPVFLTAAPNHIVDRYLELMKALGLQLVALEVETIPLVRSLLTPSGSALIVDIGNKTTTYHVIDTGTPRLSHTIDLGGGNITQNIASALSISVEEAEEEKAQYGMSPDAAIELQVAVKAVVDKQIDKAWSLLDIYRQKEKKEINKTILIGGGANLYGMREYWMQASGCNVVRIGNPWKGLSYPEELEERLQVLGPTYGVAVGLALRGFTQ